MNEDERYEAEEAREQAMIEQAEFRRKARKEDALTEAPKPYSAKRKPKTQTAHPCGQAESERTRRT